MIVQNLTSRRSGEAVRNQFKIKYPNLEVFQSYDAIVAVKFNDGRTPIVSSDWDYSKTTLKYLCQFLGIENKKALVQGIKQGDINVTGNLVIQENSLEVKPS